MATNWTLKPPMGQVIGGWFGAMIVLGIAGGWLFGPVEVTLHTVPARPAATPGASPTGAPGGTVPAREQTGVERGPGVDTDRAGSRRVDARGPRGEARTRKP